LGGKRRLAIAVGSAVLLAALIWGVVRLFTPAHPVSIQVISDVSGAAVSAGGVTCLTPNCTLHLRPGSYTLSAQKDGYKPISQPLTITATDRYVKAPLTFEPLPPATAGEPARAVPAPVVDPKQPETPAETPPVPVQPVLEIEGALPQAKVTVDGRPVGETDGNGRLRVEVAAGRHSIGISKDGYRSTRFESRFTPGGAPVRPSPAQIAMAKLPAPPAAAPVPVLGPPPPVAPIASETKQADTDAQDWAQAANSGKVQDLQDYLRKHPGSAHSRDAQVLIAQLQQADAARANLAAWNSVDKGNKAALQDFIARHGNSAQVAEARGLLDAIQRREIADVLRILTDYEAAYNRMDVAALERLYNPNNPMPPELRRQFRESKSVSFQLKATEAPVVNGDTATVICTRALAVVTKQTGSFSEPGHRVQVTLIRTGAVWTIREIK
jgi:hypothetical protein